MISTLSLIASLAAGPAVASPLSTEHFSVVIPAEVDLVGLAFGLHPEVLWRPFDPDGMVHLRASVGAMVGPELVLVPASLGVRQVFLPTRAVRPGLGFGLQVQNFFPYGHDRVTRIDQYLELTLDVRIREGWRVAFELSPEFGWVGGFGLGMAARVGLHVDLPLSRKGDTPIAD